jgi:acyl carrier protein
MFQDCDQEPPRRASRVTPPDSGGVPLLNTIGKKWPNLQPPEYGGSVAKFMNNYASSHGLLEGRSMEEQVKQVMADILDLDPSSIDESTSQDNTTTWDSLSQINLLVALEQEFGITFDPTEAESMLSFTDILEILDRKLTAK